MLYLSENAVLWPIKFPIMIGLRKTQETLNQGISTIYQLVSEAVPQPVNCLVVVGFSKKGCLRLERYTSVELS
jgi:hypothetical protein